MATSVVTHPISFDEYDNSTDVPWFAKKPTLLWPARQLLEKYSGIPPKDVERERGNCYSKSGFEFSALFKYYRCDRLINKN